MIAVTGGKCDQPTGSRARREDAASSAATCNRTATHFLPDEIYVWKYPREHYACRISRPAAGGPPVTTLRRKMYFSAHDGGGKVEICARTTLSFSRAIRFLQVATTREPVVEPKPLESSSTALQAFTPRATTYAHHQPCIFACRRRAAALHSLRARTLSPHVLCTHDRNFTRWEQIVRRTGRDESVSDRENRVYLSVFRYFAIQRDVSDEFQHRFQMQRLCRFRPLLDKIPSRFCGIST